MDELTTSKTQRMGPTNVTQQLTSKPESPSQNSLFEEDNEVSNQNMIQERIQKVFCQTRKSDYLKHAIFLTNRSLRMTDRVQQSKFILNFRKQFLLSRFINNLFTNSSILKNEQKSNVYDTILEKQERISQNKQEIGQTIGVFLPFTKIIMFWDIIGLILHLTMLWLSPFLCTFKNSKNSVINGIQSLIQFYLIVDFLVMFNRAIIIQAVIIYERKKFIRQYLQTNAIYDGINLTIWILSQYGFAQLQFLEELLIIFQIYLIYNKIQRFIAEYFQQIYCRGNQGITIDLLSLIIQIYFFAHLIACVWYYVGVQTEYLGNTWILDNNLENKSIWNKYFAAFYWATMTMTTVGYGDVVAVNQVEMIVASIVMLLSSCAFAYTMSSIGIILKNIYDSQLNFKKNLIQITQYMSKNNVDDQIQGRIRNYLKSQQYQEKNENSDDINNIINSLPFNLQQDLNIDIQARVIKQIKLIINHFSKSTQIQVAQNLQLISLLSGDVIYKQGDQSEDSLIFIHKGEVQLTENQTKIKLKVLQKNQYIGFYSFFTGFPPKETAICTQPTSLFKINRKKFLEIIKSNQKDFEIFHHIKDKIVFSSNYVLFDHKCNFCNRYFHQEVDCPLLTYQPDLEAILKKENFNPKTNIRQNFKRKFNKCPTLSSIEKYNRSMSRFQEDHQVQLFGQNENNQYDLHQKANASDVFIVNSAQLIAQNFQNSQQSEEDLYSECQHTPKNGQKQIMTQQNIKQQRNSVSKQRIVKIEHKQSRSSFAPNTTEFAIPIKFNMLEELKNAQLFQTTLQIDKILLNSIAYMPQYNFETQLRQTAKTLKRKNQRIQNLYNRFDRYTFFHKTKQLALKLRISYKRMNKSEHMSNL